MPLEFRRRRFRPPGKKGQTALAVLALLVTVAAVCAWIVVTYHSTLDKSGSSADSGSSAAASEPAYTEADIRHLLLLFTDEGFERFALLRSNPAEPAIHIAVLPADTDAGGITLAALYRRDGAAAAAEAVGRMLDITVNHYIAMDGRALEAWLNYLEGGLTVTLPEEVCFSESGSALRLPAGEHNLTATQAVGVLRYTGWQDPACGSAVTGELLAAMGRQYLTPARSFSADFASLSNTARTDLRISDFNARRPVLQTLAEKNDGTLFRVVDPAALKTDG